MSDLDWAKGPAELLLTPDFDRPRSWKERPIDVRAEAAVQVGPQRRGEVIARRVAEWREQRDAAEAVEAADSSRPCGSASAGRTGTRRGSPRTSESDRDGLRTPEIRRRRRADPYYPSSWYLWMGERGKAYVRAWNKYSWGLSERPKPWDEFKQEAAPDRRRLKFLRRKSR